MKNQMMQTQVEIESEDEVEEIPAPTFRRRAAKGKTEEAEPGEAPEKKGKYTTISTRVILPNKIVKT